MKTEAVGTVTKSGGFSRVVREVEESNEPLEITKQNIPVAMVVPATKEVVDAFELCLTFVRKYNKLMHEEGAVENSNRFHPVIEHMLNQIALGETALQMLIQILVNSNAGGAGRFIDAMRETANKNPERKALIERIIARHEKNPT